MTAVSDTNPTEATSDTGGLLLYNRAGEAACEDVTESVGESDEAGTFNVALTAAADLGSAEDKLSLCSFNTGVSLTCVKDP